MSLEKQAIKFIKMVAKNTDKPLYAGNSGGKDSAVIDKLLQLSDIKYNSYYTNTTIDPPGTIKHIRDNYKHTQILQPKESFLALVKRKGLPTRLSRYCCEHLKEYGSVGKIVFEGIRSEESSKRKNRDYIQCDTRKWQNGAQHVYPIYDWTDKHVYNFIEKYKIKLAPHYKYANRLGCIACPIISKKGQRRKELALYPKYYTVIKRAITLGMIHNPQWKISVATNGNGEAAMNWWLSGKTMDEYFNTYSFEKTKAGWVKNKKKGYIQQQISF